MGCELLCHVLGRIPAWSTQAMWSQVSSFPSPGLFPHPMKWEIGAVPTYLSNTCKVFTPWAWSGAQCLLSLCPYLSPQPPNPLSTLPQTSQLLLAELQLYWPPALPPSGPLPWLFLLPGTLAPVSPKLPIQVSA